MKVLFVTVGMPGVGDADPSPFNIEEKLLMCVRLRQLALQLLEFNCSKEKVLTTDTLASHMISNDSYFKAINHFLILLFVIPRPLLLIFFSVEDTLATVSPFF